MLNVKANTRRIGGESVRLPNNMCWGRRLPSSGKLAWKSRDMEFLRRI